MCSAERLFRFLFIGIIIAHTAILTSCPNPISSLKKLAEQLPAIPSTGPVSIEFAGEALTLAWDENLKGIEGTQSAITHFDVLYRPLGTLAWVYLQSTTGALPTITIQKQSVGIGKYEFAVQAVYGNGGKSDIHGSSDITANPPGGWYLNWRE